MLVNILQFIKLPAFVKNPKTKKLYVFYPQIQRTE